MRARKNDAQEKYILDLYEQAAGQKVNRDKSSIMFSPNTSQEIRSQIKSGMSIVSEARSERYLGLPISIGK
jgi:hypothetical protein